MSFDRRDGQELTDRIALRAAIADCDAVVHLAALHPLVAGRNASARAFTEANVPSFEALIAESQAARVRRVVLASSTSVWREAPAGEPARFLDEASASDATDDYSWSKIACEALLAATGMPYAILRLARFAEEGNEEDDVRKLYRAVDARDAARAVIAALDGAPRMPPRSAAMRAWPSGRGPDGIPRGRHAASEASS